MKKAPSPAARPSRLRQKLPSLLVLLAAALLFAGFRFALRDTGEPLPHSGDYRLCVLHKNIPGIVAQLTTVVADEKLNIANMVNKSKGDNAYTIIEINGALPQSSVEKIASLDNIIRTRVIE